MSVEIDLRQVFRALRRWGWTIVLLAVLGGVAGYGLTGLRTATYSSSTSLLVTPPLSTALVTDANRAETYRNLVESGPVLDRVIEELGLDYDRQGLADHLEATVILNTQIIQITATDESPARAAEIANATARNFEDQVADLTAAQLQTNLDELQAQAEALSTQRNEIDAQIADLDNDANQDDTIVQGRIEDMQRERLRVSQTLADLDSSIRSINEQIVTATTPVAVADAAVVPETPNSPNPLLIGVLGAFLGGLIGLALTAILEFMDTRLRKGDDVEELTSSRLLAVLPASSRQSTNGLVALSEPDSTSTESIRMLRAHLAGQIARSGRSVLVFASARGEAPTSQVVGNLGVLMAQSGIRTLIVDGDLRAPSQNRLFGLDNGTGLTSVLKGDDAVRSSATDIPDLVVLTSGPEVGNPSEVMGSAKFAALVKAARSEAEVVLVDAPAILTHSDALSAAAISDGVVLVARSGATERGDLRAAAEMIQDDGIDLLGIVVSEE
jgi:capsular exopolysaccharide synthesis family protein